MNARLSGEFSAARMSTFMFAFIIPIQICHFGGIGLLMAAIFTKRRASGVE
jgi:hypothetical protein